MPPQDLELGQTLGRLEESIRGLWTENTRLREELTALRHVISDLESKVASWVILRSSLTKIGALIVGTATVIGLGVGWLSSLIDWWRAHVR